MIGLVNGFVRGVFVCLVCVVALFGEVCGGRVFTLSSKPNLNARMLLEEIAFECALTLSYEYRAQEALDTTKVIFNFRDKKISDILSIIAKSSDTHYEIENELIRFSHLQTKTFHINYISTARVGSSNTDVVYGQESQSQYLNPYQNQIINQNYQSP